MPDAADDQPSAAPTGASLADVINGLAASGFTASFFADEHDGTVTCGDCGAVHRPTELSVASSHRLEGASDPSDMAEVLALTCPTCGRRGVLICRYGSEAGPGDAAVLLAVRPAQRG